MLVQEAVLLEWCKDFSDVFLEKTHDKLPLHRPYDHVINLKPTFTLKIAKVYSLNPQEMKTCQAFVEEHLKTGCIVLSKSPQASPFFFVPKKDSTLRPCQDYQYLPLAKPGFHHSNYSIHSTHSAFIAHHRGHSIIVLLLDPNGNGNHYSYSYSYSYSYPNPNPNPIFLILVLILILILILMLMLILMLILILMLMLILTLMLILMEKSLQNSSKV